MHDQNPLDPGQLQLQLGQFTGTQSYYRHPFVNGLLYTEGAQFFFETTESYWLLDLIASGYFPLLENEPFLSIKVESVANRAEIVVTDGNHNVLKKQTVPSTTLVSGTWPFFLTDNVLLLPSEY